MSDMIIALENKQIDAIVFSRATLENILQEKSDDLQIMPQPVGEIEAAEALGMSKLQIFAKIIFPQAIQKIFGVYKRQVKSVWFFNRLIFSLI